jgi:hypothetical protein
MPARFRTLVAAAVAAWALLLAGCATQPVSSPARPAPAANRLPPALALDRATEDRILALDPERLGADDVKSTLSAAPAPRIILIHGGIYPVYLVMNSFGRFLTRMGYPDTKIRHPGDRRWSHSPYEDSARIAGFAAWAYEQDGLRPMLIGHSQGGIQAVKVLRELDGAYDENIRVWDPIADAPTERTTIVDPLTGAVRPVRGLSLSYASSVAAGGAALLLPNQWSMMRHLRTIPDTVDDFTGYAIGLDLWAWTVAGAASGEYRSNGRAQVRNVALPAWYNHVVAPAVQDLPEDPSVRAWIEAYTPDAVQTPVPLEESGRSVLWAADVWHSVKRHWCLEAQRLIRARRAALGET